MKILFKLLGICFVIISMNAMEYQENGIVLFENKEEIKDRAEINYFDLIPDETFAHIANWLVIVSPREDIEKNCINWKLTCKRSNKIKPVVNKEVVEYLSEKTKYLSPLHIAVEFDLLRYVTNALASNEEDLTRKINSCLFHAAGYDSVKVAELLIRNGALVNSQNFLGMTPLHNAVAKNSRKVARLLLAHGALVDACDNGGSSVIGTIKFQFSL